MENHKWYRLGIIIYVYLAISLLKGVPGHHNESCCTREGRAGLCVLKQYCREAGTQSLLSCHDRDLFCCPLPDDPSDSDTPSCKPPTSPRPHRHPENDKKHGTEYDYDPPRPSHPHYDRDDVGRPDRPRPSYPDSAEDGTRRPGNGRPRPDYGDSRRPVEVKPPNADDDRRKWPEDDRRKWPEDDRRKWPEESSYRPPYDDDNPRGTDGGRPHPNNRDERPRKPQTVRPAEGEERPKPRPPAFNPRLRRQPDGTLIRSDVDYEDVPDSNERIPPKTDGDKHQKPPCADVDEEELEEGRLRRPIVECVGKNPQDSDAPKRTNNGGSRDDIQPPPKDRPLPPDRIRPSSEYPIEDEWDRSRPSVRDPPEAPYRPPSRDDGRSPTYDPPRTEGRRPTFNPSRDEGRRPTYDFPRDDERRPAYDFPGDEGRRPTYDNPGDEGRRPTYDDPRDEGRRPTYNPPRDEGRRPVYYPPRDEGRRPTYNPPRDEGRRPAYYPPREEGRRPTYNPPRDVVTYDHDDKPTVPECGVKPYQMFIAGGEASEPHEWPWMVALFRRFSARPKAFICGGSLINTHYVLTAAHCVFSEGKGRMLRPSELVVRLGSHSLVDGDEFAVSENGVVPHDRYRSGGVFDDVALLRLTADVEISDRVALLCLPPTSGRLAGDLTKRMATVAGWGDQGFGRGDAGSQVLRHVSVPVWASEECEAVYSRIKQTAFMARGARSVMCAGLRVGGKDACLGDSGGPLMLKDSSDRWTVVGIVSLGHECAKPEFPGLYSRVTYYLPWIRDNIRD